jgi:hypothetical protein
MPYLSKDDLSGIFGLQECGGYPREGMPEQRDEGCVCIRALVEENEGLQGKKCDG